MANELLGHKEVLDTIRFELLAGGCPEHIVDEWVGEVVEARDWAACWNAYFQAEHIDPDGTSRQALDEATKCKDELDRANPP